MQFQSIYESVTRCLGQSAETGAAMFGMEEGGGDHAHDGDSQQQQNRRGPMHKNSRDDDKEGIVHWENGSQKQPVTASASAIMEEARSVAKAKQVANPSRYSSSSRRKRKSGNKKEPKEDIFRDKHGPSLQHKKQPMTFTQMLIPSIALCFATPIRETQDNEPDETSTVRSCGEEESETGTLNTYEDTVTSTVLFESKYSHIQESQPPMPLFNQFKVGGQKDEIRNIVHTNSHSSARMMKFLQETGASESNNTSNDHYLEDDDEGETSSDSGHNDEDHRRHPLSSPPPPPPPPPLRSSRNNNTTMDDVLPDVKEMSSSSTSRSSSSKVHREPMGTRL